MKEKMKQEYNAPKVKVVKFVVEKGFGTYNGQVENYIVQDGTTVNTNTTDGPFEYSF